MCADIQKGKGQTIKCLLRRIHPFCWLLLLFAAIGWAVNISQLILWREVSDAKGVLITLLLASLITMGQVGLYELMFRFKLSRRIQWALLAFQVILVLALIQITQAPQVMVVFSLAFFVALLEILKRPVPILLGSLGYLACLLLFLQTPTAHPVWISFWQGKDALYELLELFTLAGLLLYLQQRRSYQQTRAFFDELKVAHAQLSAYALRVEELTMLTERQRLARELHDTLTQGVTGLLMQLEAACSHLSQSQPERAHEIVLSATIRARTVLTETRYVLQDLRDDRPRPDDLPEMVQEEIERFTASTGIPCETEIEALAQTPEVHCRHVWRAINEGLRNIAHHAQAHHVSLRATAHQEKLIIEIGDDGVGFDPHQATTCPGHYGLVGLRERVKLIGGALDIKSQPGAGTRISIYVPMTESRSCA